MFPGRAKIVKPLGEKPTEFEASLSKSILELEMTKELKPQLQDLHDHHTFRTLTSVHDAILADIVYPAEIVGKRISMRLNGSRLIKVHLDKCSQTDVGHKADLFSAIYKDLTGKEAIFEFPEPLF